MKATQNYAGIKAKIQEYNWKASGMKNSSDLFVVLERYFTSFGSISIKHSAKLLDL